MKKLDTNISRRIIYSTDYPRALASRKAVDGQNAIDVYEINQSAQ